MATKRQASGAVNTLRAFVKKCKAAKTAGAGTKKPKKRKKAATAKRDWPGHKKAHSKAAKKGHRKAGTAKKRTAKRKTAKRKTAPAFFGRPAARHARRDSSGDPRHFRGSRPGPHRGRGHAPGGWRMTRDPE
jgi:hypothetical protein